MNIKKITSVIMVISIAAVLFTGCSSTKTNTTASAPDSVSATPGADGRSNKGVDSAQLNEVYTTTLKALVADKTITQAQSDKVLEALTTAPQKNGDRQNKAQPNATPDANAAKPDGTPSAKGQKPSGTPSANGRGSKNGRLNELVSSQVITQAQADTINQKIQEAMKNVQTSSSKE